MEIKKTIYFQSYPTYWTFPGLRSQLPVMFLGDLKVSSSFLKLLNEFLKYTFHNKLALKECIPLKDAINTVFECYSHLLITHSTFS